MSKLHAHPRPNPLAHCLNSSLFFLTQSAVYLRVSLGKNTSTCGDAGKLADPKPPRTTSPHHRSTAYNVSKKSKARFAETVMDGVGIRVGPKRFGKPAIRAHHVTPFRNKKRPTPTQVNHNVARKCANQLTICKAKALQTNACASWKR